MSLSFGQHVKDREEAKTNEQTINRVNSRETEDNQEKSEHLAQKNAAMKAEMREQRKDERQVATENRITE